MLEQIDLDLSLSKRAYNQRISELQARLYTMEQALYEARLPVLIVFEGWAGTSKVRTIGVLVRRLDPRGLRVHSITPPRTSETLYPWLYRFWLKLPSYGQLAIFDRSWYREMLAARTAATDNAQRWRQRCEDAVIFERQLADDGALILKFWLHISRKEQGRRFKALLANKLTAYQVTDEDRRQHRHYATYAATVEDLIARTGTPHAPWHVIPATNKYHARVTVISTVLAALEDRLGRPLVPTDDDATSNGFDAAGIAFRRRSALNAQPAGIPAEPEQLRPPLTFAEPVRAEKAHILRRVDLSLRLDENEYARQRRRLQAQLHLLGLALYQQQRPAVLVFEGWDAAGKGGSIQRLTAEIDPRSYTVHTIAAPSGEDKLRHYLYRFWRRLPPRGQIAIFDRSWYGRVLVERVEGFARPDEWQRAYAEINEFERQLVEFGTIICKFWLHLSPEEQLRRFQERQNIPFKAWKLTDEDWRNREKWPQYEEAVDEMLLRSSTPAAPWTIVEAEDKRFARIKVLRTVVQRLEAELGKIEL
jgi:AMP-polyphosphate phosphotransferase